jgi:phosphoglycolate phosphatase
VVAGILTGGHTRDRLRRAGATHLLGSIAELPGVLIGPPGQEGDRDAAAPPRPGAGSPQPPTSAPIVPPS